MSEAIEADFQQVYGLPLRPGRAYTWRRFGVLLRGLDQDSRFARVMRTLQPSSGSGSGPVYVGDWSRVEQLLAQIADLLHGANWQRAGGKTALKQIFTFTAPSSSGRRPSGRKTLSDEQVRERLALRGPRSE